MKSKNILINWRFLLIAFVFVSALVAIILKIFSIQLTESNFLQNEGNKRYVKYKNINPVRGSIFDRNNYPLAVSIVNYDIYALKGFKKSQLLSLAEVLDIDIDVINDSFRKKTILKKGLSNREILNIKALNLRNFEIEERHSRHYPLGEQIAPLIGFYGTDGAKKALKKVMIMFYQELMENKSFLKMQNRKLFHNLLR